MDKADTRTGEIMTDSFVDTLKELRHGAAVTDLSNALRELVASVRATGSKGALVLTVLVAPASKGEVNALLIEDSVKVKLPKSSKGVTILFSSDDGVLSRRDPRQPELVGLVPAQVTQLVPRDSVANGGGQ